MKRWSMLLVLAALAGACNDDDEKPLPAGDASIPTDASAPTDASTPANPTVPGDASVPTSRLERPGTLERPPTSLPADLKPPR